MARPGVRAKALVKKAKNFVRVGNYPAAKSVLREALFDAPDNHKLLHLAGHTAYQLGEYAPAVTLLRRALELAASTEVLSDLGLTHQALGDIDESATCFAAAVRFEPKNFAAHLGLARACREQGDLIAALESFHAAFQLDRTSAAATIGLTGILGLVITEQHDATIEELLVDVYRTDGVSYQSLAPAAAHQIVKKYGIDTRGECAVPLDCNDPLVSLYLTKCFNVVPALEHALTKRRRDLLFSLRADSNSADVGIALLIALQSFNNEYIFFADADELKEVSSTQRSIESALASGSTPDSFRVLAVSMFQPLSAISEAERYKDQLTENTVPGFRDVVTITLQHSLEEQALKASISSFSAIANQTSKDVQNQYEQHPYPRWIYLSTVAPVDLAAELTAKFPHYRAPQFLSEPRKILVAGCGTGRHAALVALQWPDADVLAIDLSSASIAYAMRKAAELRIENLRFLQGDILEAANLGGCFDMIQSIGVLHHMKNPVAGWQVLSDLLREEGVFKGGLYCERGRQGVFAARRAIAEANVASDRAGIAVFAARFCVVR